MCLPPLGYRADLNELMAFFGEIASATSLPLMIYNSPGGSRNDLEPDLIARLSNIPNVAAVKETSGDARRIPAILELARPGLEVVVGADDIALEGLCNGAVGWVTGCGVVAPRLAVELYDRLLAGDLTGARETYRRLLPLARLDTHPKLVQFFKAGLDLVGQYGGPSRPPRLALNPDEETLVREAVAVARAQMPVPTP